MDEAGNKSPEVMVTVTTPPDTIAPSTAPVITVEHVNDTYVKLRWSPAVDNGPYLFYDVWINGQFFVSTGTDRHITIDQLTPETTYTIAVQARDYANNLSPFSAPVTITTAPLGSVDTTPPTRPENLIFLDQGCGQVILFWTQSTDNFDDPSLIRYDIYVQGMFDHSVVGVGSTTALGTADIDCLHECRAGGCVLRVAPGEPKIPAAICVQRSWHYLDTDAGGGTGGYL